MPPNSSTVHRLRTGDVPYESPVMRPPSPTGSINTEYGPDETDPVDLLLTDEEFERKVLEDLRVHEQTETEKRNEKGPVLLTFLAKAHGVQPGSHEEKVMYMSTMAALKKRVDELIEDELVESMMLRGSQVPFDTPSATGDIDEIMRSIMGPSYSRADLAGNEMLVDDEDDGKYDLRHPTGDGFVSEQPHPGKGKDRAR